MDDGRFIQYGYLLDPRIADVSIWVPRWHWVHLPITAQRGFYVVLPPGVNSPRPLKFTRADGTSFTVPNGV